MKPTVHNPIEGMIETTGRYTKKVGGKRYLVYFETIARQVKLDDGKTVQEVADTVADYFRLAQQYVAERAEAAKQSEDNAKASELAAKDSENAAAASQRAAAASERAAAASEAHCQQIASDVDAAIERAAYDQITERVVPRVIDEARDQAVDILVPEITDRLAQGLNVRADAKFAEQDARLDGFEERLSADELATFRSISELSAVAMRHEEIIEEDEQKHAEDVEKLNSRIDAEKAELDEKISTLEMHTHRMDSESQVQHMKTITHLAELQQRFDEHQLNDTERFSNLSYASVVHTRKILEISEEASADLLNRFLVTSRMCLLHIMDYLDDARDYLASISSQVVGQHVQPDGTATTANHMNFVTQDGTVVLLNTLTLNRS